MSEKHIPLIINENNISVAWAKALLAGLSPEKELIPLILTVNELNNKENWEDLEIRSLLDSNLKKLGKQSCKTVASTIFPESLWNAKANREQLYERYFKILPAIKKCSKNRHGVYFERLIDFNESGNLNEANNQLEHVILTRLNGNHRRSALQVSIYDPKRDQSNQRQLGFPCLQHITFVPHADEKGLTINAFYATQYLFERAYGNYLGLCNLGRFVAHELNLELIQMNCMVGIAKEDVSNSSIKELIQELKNKLEKTV